MKKLSILGLICLLVFISCKSPADPEIEKVLANNPGTSDLLAIEYFNANPMSIEFDEATRTSSWPMATTILSWSTTNATMVTIDQGVGAVTSIGMIEVSLEETTTYTMTAKNSDGYVQKTCTVPVITSAFIVFTKCYSGPDYVTDDGHNYWDLTVKNVGNATAYNVVVMFQAFNEYYDLIDTAYGYPTDGGNIPVGTEVSFIAIFFEIHNEEDYRNIASQTWEIIWVNESGETLTQTGIVNF